MLANGSTFIIFFYSVSLNNTIFLKCADFDLLVWTLMHGASFNTECFSSDKIMNMPETKLWNINLN